MIVTDQLARRFEMAEAADAAGCAEAAYKVDAECQAATRAVAGGYLAFCGCSSPLTHAIGAGMHGPVTLEEIQEIEAFFKQRNAPVAIDVCPHAHPTLREGLYGRGYQLNEFNNVLFRPVSNASSYTAPSYLKVTETADGVLYADTLTRGFFGRADVTAEEQRLGSLLFHMACAKTYLCYVGERVAGACAVSIRNGIANCFGDATLPEFRGRGAHPAMIEARLQAAAAAGCEFVIATTQPGSLSQRNYQRAGFAVAYSKITLIRE